VTDTLAVAAIVAYLAIGAPIGRLVARREIADMMAQPRDRQIPITPASSAATVVIAGMLWPLVIVVVAGWFVMTAIGAWAVKRTDESGGAS